MLEMISMIGGLKSTLDTVRSAIGVAKDIKDSLPKSEIPKLEQKIRESESALESAEAAIAQVATGLGYRLCRGHWPPKIMVRIGEDTTTLEEIHRCLDCGTQDPSNERLQRMADNNKVYIAPVKRGWEFFDDI